MCVCVCVCVSLSGPIDLETEVCTEIPDTKILLYTSSTHN